MQRRTKVELFEQIRREYEFGVGSIKGVARKLGVHRRMVRQALADAQPAERRSSKRVRPVVGHAEVDDALPIGVVGPSSFHEPAEPGELDLGAGTQQSERRRRAV